MVQAELTDTLAAWEEEQKITAEAGRSIDRLKVEKTCQNISQMVPFSALSTPIGVTKG